MAEKFGFNAREVATDQAILRGKKRLAIKEGWVSVRSTLPRGFKRNPAPRHDAEIEAAAKLQESFSGHDPENVTSVRVSDAKVFTPVGKLAGVLYDTTRDGKREKYIHKFRRKSRPLLATSHDGTELRIVGGRFHFTEAGIVDK